MQQSVGTGSIATTALIYILIIGLLIYRFSRPQRISLVRMWVAPSLAVLLSAFSIWAEQRIIPLPIGTMLLALTAGVACGIPLGYLRGRHTNVRATDKPGVMYLDASWIVLVIWFGAFILRAALRILFSHGTIAFVLGDGLLAFAVTAVVVSYYIIYKKYHALEIQAGQIS